MSNTAQILALIDALLSMSINVTMAVQEYTAVVSKARAENRDVSDEELAALAAKTDAMRAQTMAVLGMPTQT